MSKKLIAGAGVVASFAIALAPLATFADEANYNSDSHQDKLNITVMPSCTFGNANLAQADMGVTHTAGAAVAAIDGAVADPSSAPAWEATTGSTGVGRKPDTADGINGNGATLEADSNKTGEAAGAYDDTLTYSMYAGTYRDDLGTTTLKVYCNNNGGYTVKARTLPLVEVTAEATKAEIPASASYSASVSGYALFSVDVDSDTTPMTVDEASKFVSANDAKIAHKDTPSKETGDKLKITYGIGVKPSQKAATYEGSVVYTLIQGVNAQNNG